jgi:hypothetical protein
MESTSSVKTKPKNEVDEECGHVSCRVVQRQPVSEEHIVSISKVEE